MYRLFFVLISLIATQAFAADVANLYQSQLRIQSQSEIDRQKLTPKILQKVILKVVGDRALLADKDLSPVLSQADKLVKQHEYHQLNVISDDVTKPDQLALSLTFKDIELNKHLRALGLPIWSKSRPETLIWLAVNRDNKRSIIASDNKLLHIVENLQQAAKARGLPILLPTMDLQDQAEVSFVDLWGGFSDPIVTASARYGAEVVLMAKVSENNGVSQIRWQAIINNEMEQWQSKGNINSAITSGVDQLADHLARNFTQVIDNNDLKNKMRIEVSQVRDYADYSRLMTYLAKLQYISNIRVLTMQPDQVKIEFDLEGNETGFNQSLKVDRVLVEKSMQSGIVQYQLLP